MAATGQIDQAMHDGVPYQVPREPGRWRAIGLAAVVHVALFAFLWVGIRWQNEMPVAVEAEVWSPQAKEAAPRAVAPPPAPEPVATPQPAPQPAPVTVKPPPQVETPPEKTPDIVLERERKRQQQLKAKEQEQEQARELARERTQEEARQAAKARALAEQKQEQQQKLKAQQAADRQAAQKRLAQQEAANEKRLAEMDRAKKAEEQKKQQAARQKEVALQEQKEKAQHDARVRQLMAAADAPSASSSAAVGSGGNGEAARSQGSRADASYTQKVGAKIKSNTIFNGADALTSNPAVEFAVELLPDGSIRRLRKTKSSGVPGFDEAVTRAIEKSAPFPPDKSGMAPSGFTVSHRPKDQ